MDLITHTAAAASIAWALPQRLAGKKAARIAIAGAILPDLDSFIEPYVAAGSAFEHRAFTHSLAGVAVIAPLVALVLLWLSKEERSSTRYARLVGLLAAGMLSHVALDLPTEIGAKVFYPFSHETVFLDWLGHIDLTLIILSLFVYLAVWTYAKRDGALRRGILSSALLASVTLFFFAALPVLVYSSDSLGPTREPFSAVYPNAPFITVFPVVVGAVMLALIASFARNGLGFRHPQQLVGRIGVAAFSMYILMCWAAHRLAVNQIDEFARERGLEVMARTATRLEPNALVAPLRWTGLIRAPEGVYKAELRPFSARRQSFRFFPNATEDSIVARARSSPTVQAFWSTARFPVSCYQKEGSQHVVEFYDHGSGVGVIRVDLNERLERLAVRWIGYMEYAPGASAASTDIAQELHRAMVRTLDRGDLDPSIRVQRTSVSPCFFTRDARVAARRAPQGVAR